MCESVVTVVRHGVWRRLRVSACVVMTCVLPSAAARSETLTEALSSAYYTNHTLNAKRAEQRAIDEGVPIALSDLRPSVSFSADAGVRRTNLGLTSTSTSLSSVFPEGKTWPSGYSFTLNQNLFRGFRTINATRQAKAEVFAGIESLRSVEQTTLLDAVTAYIDVLRDQAIVRLRENNVKVLNSQLRATKDRFEVGEVTRTDVAQSQARLSGAISELSLARSNLKTSRATYEQVIGHPPSRLQLPKPINALLPRLLEDALAIANEENPDILNAAFLAEAAHYAVKKIVGELLPEVTFETNYQMQYEPSRTTEDSETTTYIGRVNVPLYQAGSVAAQIRQAKDTKRQLQTETAAARTEIRADVVSAWGQLESARGARSNPTNPKSKPTASRSRVFAMKSMSASARSWTCLDAEQDLLDSSVKLVTSKRVKAIAEYSLIFVTGQLNSYYLDLPVQHYDPLQHYHKAKFKLLGLSGGREDWLEGLRNSIGGNEGR